MSGGVAAPTHHSRFWCIRRSSGIRATSIGGRSMVDVGWSLTDDERQTLGTALDALLPPEGSFPLPSATDLIDGFIVRRVPPAGTEPVPYPGLDADGLRA